LRGHRVLLAAHGPGAAPVGAARIIARGSPQSTDRTPALAALRVKVVDINISLSAVNRSSPHHAAVRTWWEAAHLAALAIGHGATLVSCDSDFARCPKLRRLEPIAT